MNSDDATALPTITALRPSVAADSIVCRQPDCALPNPQHRVHCMHCGDALHADTPALGAASVPQLLRALRDDYRIIGALWPSDGEAARYLVVHNASQETCVAKLYRREPTPDPRLLALFANATTRHLVRVRAHGVSDGIAYEVRDYVSDASLRSLLASSPLCRSDVRSIVAELAAALAVVHAEGSAHGDLRPENVLLRSHSPLLLALADFGSAPGHDAADALAGCTRTARYAAPETLSGAADEKADWWAVGMIVREATTGLCPFAGLTERVIRHHLATRPIDVRAVLDPALNTLCRGLLLRDPARRWGAAEVARWQQGDAPVIAPDDTEDRAAAAIEPYEIGDVECLDAAELAVALAQNWDAAVRDVTGGRVARWIEEVLHDYDLARKLRTIARDAAISDDMCLLTFLLAADPDLSPFWRGRPVSVATLTNAAWSAMRGDEPSQAWLDSIAREGVLSHYAAMHADLCELDRRWRDGWKRFLRRWKSAQTAEHAWRKAPKAVAGVASAQIVSIDDLLYSSPLWLAPPPHASVSGALLLTLVDDAFARSLQQEIASGGEAFLGVCPWYDTLCDHAGDDPIGALVAQRMLPYAREDAAMETRRRDGGVRARARILADAQEDLASRLRVLRQIATAKMPLGEGALLQLYEALCAVEDACANALGQGFADAPYLAYCSAVRNLAGRAIAAQRALYECLSVKRTNAKILRPRWLALGGGALVVALALKSPLAGLALLLLCACGAGYRVYRVARANRKMRTALRALDAIGNEIVCAQAPLAATA